MNYKICESILAFTFYMSFCIVNCVHTQSGDGAAGADSGDGAAEAGNSDGAAGAGNGNGAAGAGSGDSRVVAVVEVQAMVEV